MIFVEVRAKIRLGCFFLTHPGCVTGRKIATLVELRQVLVEEWTNFPQEIISNAIQQFRPRLRKVVEENGGHIEQFF